jgi:hypothetical protein
MPDSASTNAATLANRSAGFFAIALSIASTTATDSAGARSRSGDGAS